MSPVTFTPQANFDVQVSAFSTLADLAQTARPTAQTGSPWMSHGNGCRCLLCG